jgi:putative transposase
VKKITISKLCQTVGMSRQNYYKARTTRRRKQLDKEFILKLVQTERALQPKLGCRKVLKLIEPELECANVSIGRDLFFKLMRESEMLIKRTRRCVSTTNSRHGFRVYGNLLKEFVPDGANQVLVSDITYLRTDEGFVYLALIMDAFSRKIVGYDCSDSLEADGCLRALSRAIKQLPAGSGTIHHSDRGSQYCCHRYVDKLKSAGLYVSMTEDNHCYENAQAERLNGILKQEYALGSTFKYKKDAYRLVDQAVMLYNTRRPHVALGYCFPETVHQAA